MFLILLAPVSGSAQDLRTAPIAVNLIIDGSQAFKNAGDEPINWLCGYVVDQILGENDHITIWNAAEKARIVFSDTVKNGGGKDEIKKILRSLTIQGNQADFTGALREASARVVTAFRPAWTLTFLVSGSSAALSPSLLGAGAPLLRYSRIEEYPRWRALTVALDIESRVKQAAAVYMAGN